MKPSLTKCLLKKRLPMMVLADGAKVAKNNINLFGTIKMLN
jgi:hypothetical protein